MRMDYVPVPKLVYRGVESALREDDGLAAAITKAASKQTYYTIRFLADRKSIQNAYRAYAYFRWVDDCVDQQASHRAERIAFLERQQELVNRCYQGESVFELLPQEEMLATLIESDHAANSGLQLYIRKMMAVMAFDAYRRGRLVTGEELRDYSLNLATGVTEALHYFIGHTNDAPRTEARYLAVTGAHITHMLRDTYEDVAAGYEVIQAFEKVLPLHRQANGARQVADQYFFETVVRIHRAGEGAPFTGLKPAGLDVGPVIPVAEKAIETESPDELEQLLVDIVRSEVRKRFDHMLHLKKHAQEEVDAARHYVEAMLGLQVYSHKLYLCARAEAHEGGHEHEH